MPNLKDYQAGPHRRTALLGVHALQWIDMRMDMKSAHEQLRCEPTILSVGPCRIRPFEQWVSSAEGQEAGGVEVDA